MENITQHVIENRTLPDTGYYVCNLRMSSYEEYITFFSMLSYFNPLVAFLGLLSNMISLAILRRCGLQKPSTILLFGLVVADSMCLITPLNYGAILLYFGPNKPFPRLCGFQYEDNLNTFLAFSGIFIEFIGIWGQYVNTWIPVLITLERLFAIFKPLTFKSIITKKRILALVCFCYLFWLPWNLYYSIVMRIVVSTYQDTNYALVRYISNDVRTVKDFIETEVLEHLKSSIPVILISVGCLSLFIKINESLKKRAKITSSSQSTISSTRTTRTLMLTCVLFVITQLIHIAAISLYQSTDVGHYLVRNEFMYLVNNINASCNLVVYITSNKKLYDIFVQLFRRPQLP
ncbi:G-protein coupled receptor [Biomphalaria pfeifferi]|uniref:G-protein coupled receptor n=1 Tax=Biomphalaria pfeifferi TaxID=112525 RepID=A0AAD8C7L1_BIOPF|nr:G-protein coupled receptor [Biomphalaria pfeifferi]